jgi:hypothetical protein
MRLLPQLLGGIACAVAAWLPLQADEHKDELKMARQRDAANMRRIAAAVLKCTDPGGIPAAALMSNHNKPLLSWRVTILPHLGEGDLFKEFHLDEPWDSPHNKKLLKKMPKVYAPARGKREPYSTYYQVFVGGGAGFELDRLLIYPGSYPDGLAATIMLVEGATAVPWTKPADLPYDPKKELPKLGGTFADGFHVAMFNGDVHFFRRDFDRKEMRHVITRDGGELMDFDKLKP